MANKIAVYKTVSYYPNKKSVFRPDTRYPEYLFKNDVSAEKNEVYDAVRNILFMLGLDKEHFGSEEWNPFKNLIKPGDTVLIKPNLVMDVNPTGEGTECLYTQPAVVAPVIDYCIMALGNTGRIIIGDAPMQECDFETLIHDSGYRKLVDYYRQKKINIELVDFRELTSVYDNGVHKAKINPNSQGRVIDIATASEFANVEPNISERMRITNYDPSILPQHHVGIKHEYYVSEYVLSADVIINMPKPKSHRKAGATISLKNLVGINVRKEYLPHHTMGSVAEGGDEYLVKSTFHTLHSEMLDVKNTLEAKKLYLLARLIRYPIRFCSLIMKMTQKKEKLFFEGSWYGNRTISRTISDLNRILLYVDKNGNLKDTIQRKTFILGDMIISGEGEGPVEPSSKNVGMIVAGDDPVAFDYTVSTLMGFDPRKIPAIMTASSDTSKYRISNIMLSEIVMISNDVNFDKKHPDEITYEESTKFIPTSGWKGHIELDR